MAIGRLELIGMAAVAAAFMAAPAWAQDGDDPLAKVRAEMVKKYDKDGDGELSWDERREMGREGMIEWRNAVQKAFDKDGDGELSESERESLNDSMRARREQQIEEYRERRRVQEWDKDGDGILSDSEKAAMEQAQAEAKAKLEESNKQIVAMYDGDSDGELSAAEVEAMKAKVAELVEHLRAVQTLARTMQAEGDSGLADVVSPIRELSGGRGGFDRGRGGDSNRGEGDRGRFGRGGDRGGDRN